MIQPASLLRSPFRPRVLVVGDVLLDRYLWGNVTRISPEAPIPLLRVVRNEHRLGGAGSVASMLAALGAQVELAAICGSDPPGQILCGLLDASSIDRQMVLVDLARPTTVKERFLGLAQSRHPQQMIRVDYEDDRAIEPELAGRLLDQARRAAPQAQVILVSDYNKGVCAGETVPRLVEAAGQAGVPVIADPVLGADYRRYRGCACITPNRLEASQATGRPIESPDDGLAAAAELLGLGIESVIVTLDRDGMAWAHRDGRRAVFPVRQRQVYDITGAGDMALSMMGFGLAGGLDWPQIIELANVAGGLEVERLGVVPLTRGEILAELEPALEPARQKILPLDKLLEALASRRQAGQRIAMTNGCFDLLHPGHVASLATARQQGDCLVVGLNSDRSVRQLKGAGRPIIDEVGRATMLAALECVDYVVLFDEASVASLVDQIRPDVLVKAAQYGAEQVVGHEIVTSYGGRIHLAGMQGNYSTTELVRRLLDSASDEGG